MKMESNKKRFYVYTDWKELTDLMTDEELRRFWNNLMGHIAGNEPDLPTKHEKMSWIGVARALNINQQNYEKTVAKNRENGKLGGAPLGNPNAKKKETTQNNPNNPIIDNREEIMDKSKKTMEKGERRNEIREEVNDKSSIGPDMVPVTWPGKLEENSKILIPGTTMVENDYSPYHFKSMMIFLLKKYVAWPEDIYELNLEHFIDKGKEFCPELDSHIDIIKGYLYHFPKQPEK